MANQPQKTQKIKSHLGAQLEGDTLSHELEPAIEEEDNRHSRAIYQLAQAALLRRLIEEVRLSPRRDLDEISIGKLRTRITHDELMPSSEDLTQAETEFDQQLSEQEGSPLAIGGVATGLVLLQPSKQEIAARRAAWEKEDGHRTKAERLEAIRELERDALVKVNQLFADNVEHLVYSGLTRKKETLFLEGNSSECAVRFKPRNENRYRVNLIEIVRPRKNNWTDVKIVLRSDRERWAKFKISLSRRRKKRNVKAHSNTTHGIRIDREETLKELIKGLELFDVVPRSGKI